MNYSELLIWLVVLIEMVLCITLLVVLCRVMRGIHIDINVHHPEAKKPDAEHSPNLDVVQQKLDELEKDRRKGEQQLTDLIGTINDYMTGGNENGQ